MGHSFSLKETDSKQENKQIRSLLIVLSAMKEIEQSNMIE